jgi:hypothetical protein
MIVTRPLTIGEIFDRAITLLVRNRRAVVVLAMFTGAASAIENGVYPGRPETAAAWFGNGAFEAADDAVGAVALLTLATLAAARAATLRSAWYQLWTSPRRLAGMLLLYVAGAQILWWIDILLGPTKTSGGGPLVSRAVFGLLALLLMISVVGGGLFELGVALVSGTLEGVGAWRSLRMVVWRSLRPPQLGRSALIVAGLVGAVLWTQMIVATLGILWRSGPIGTFVVALENVLSGALTWLVTSAITIAAAMDLQLRFDGSDIEAELDADESYGNVSVSASPTAISPGVGTEQ